MLLAIFLIFLVVALINNKFVYDFLGKKYPSFYDIGYTPKLPATAALSLAAALVIYIIVDTRSKESFFFKVSEPQPKCQPGFNGKNVGFEYTQPGEQDC
jgi:hypothetical protein